MSFEIPLDKLLMNSKLEKSILIDKIVMKNLKNFKV